MHWWQKGVILKKRINGDGRGCTCWRWWRATPRRPILLAGFTSGGLWRCWLSNSRLHAATAGYTRPVRHPLTGFKSQPKKRKKMFLIICGAAAERWAAVSLTQSCLADLMGGVRLVRCWAGNQWCAVVLPASRGRCATDRGAIFCPVLKSMTQREMILKSLIWCVGKKYVVALIFTYLYFCFYQMGCEKYMTCFFASCFFPIYIIVELLDNLSTFNIIIIIIIKFVT